MMGFFSALNNITWGISNSGLPSSGHWSDSKGMKSYHYEKLDNLLKDRGQLRPLDVALVGATGVGKSSTINFLFGDNVAKVGTGVDPETQVNARYDVSDIFRIHDTAGLGDSIEADNRHARNISDLLLRPFTQSDNQSYYLIDLVLVILDGSSRDMGTAYQVLQNVVLNCIEPERVIVVINQADMAMKGRNWDYYRNEPNDELRTFLDEKALSVKRRIKDATNLDIRTPVYYSAQHNYNLDALVEHIFEHIPYQRRKIG